MTRTCAADSVTIQSPSLNSTLRAGTDGLKVPQWSYSGEKDLVFAAKSLKNGAPGRNRTHDPLVRIHASKQSGGLRVPRSYGHVLPSRVAGFVRSAAHISSRCLHQLLQLFESFGILRVDCRVIAAGIGSLQSTNHGARNRDWSAPVVGFAHEVPLRSGCNMTGKVVPSKPIDDVGKPSSPDLCSIFRHVQLKNSQSCVVVLKPLSRLTMASPGTNWMTDPDGYTAPVVEFAAASVALRLPVSCPRRIDAPVSCRDTLK